MTDFLSKLRSELEREKKEPSLPEAALAAKASARPKAAAVKVGNAALAAGAHEEDMVPAAGVQKKPRVQPAVPQKPVKTTFESFTEGTNKFKNAVDYVVQGAVSVVGELTVGAVDENAARAHQVVDARRLHKKINAAKSDEERKELEAKLGELPPDVQAQVEKEQRELTRQGRRRDIQEKFEQALKDWQDAGGEGPAPRQPLVVRLAIGGSGDAAWRTHCDIKGILTDEDLKKTKQAAGDENTVHYTHGSGTREYEWNFAGPGAPDTTDAVISGGGSDTGSNQIANLVKNAGELVKKAVDDALKNEETKGRPIVILVKGHSRGGVAAGRIAEYLRKQFPAADVTDESEPNSSVSVEVAQIDPVPGPGQGAENKEIDVGTIDESTVVYGVYSGHGVSFTPMRVLGAKRVIISAQKHGVGIQNGFIFNKRLFTGNSLNSLPEGVYYDDNPDISRPGELKKVGTLADVRSTFVSVYSKRYPSPRAAEGLSGQNYDADRKENIEATLKRAAEDMEKRSEKEFDDLFKQVAKTLIGK